MKIDAQTLTLPQPIVRIAMEFYNDDEKKKFLKYPNAEALKAAVKNGIEVSTEEFLTYYLFHKKRPGKAGWRDHNDVGQKIGHALVELADWVNFNGDSISTPLDIDKQDNAITERIGESIGLSVVSAIHGLTEADWERIPIHAGKSGFRTFDYEIASDGGDIIQTETKGSSTSDNSIRTSSISNHKSNIAAKKEAMDKQVTSTPYLYPADLRYGTITVMGEDPQIPVRCLLVDPPSDEDQASARKVRLINRMQFLRDWISFSSPRSQLASALNTRVASLLAMNDPFELQDLKLRRGNNEPFELSPIDRYGHTTFFLSNAWVSDGPAGGVVVPVLGNLGFLGFREELLSIAAAQDFDALLDYEAPVVSLRKTIAIQLSESRFTRFELPEELRSHERLKESPDEQTGPGGYVEFSLTGELHYAKNGLVFGILPVPRPAEVPATRR